MAEYTAGSTADDAPADPAPDTAPDASPDTTAATATATATATAAAGVTTAGTGTGADTAGGTGAAAGLRAGRREWVGLAVLALPTLLISIDVFVMLLALPHLSTDLGADSTQQLWIMDIYGFMIAGFLVTMGGLGDRIGRRRLLLTGAAAFGAASVAAAYSTSPEMLIGARALLGIAGATLAPSTLALITNMFRDPRQRALAISVWMVCFMSGAAIGPLVGGAMLAVFWWGSVFLLGVPAMVLLLVLGPVLLPEYRDTRATRLDPASVVLSLAAILPVIYGLKELARYGWQPVPVIAIVTGAAFGLVFAARQRRLTDPLLDLKLFTNRAFSSALGTMMLSTLLSGAIMLFVTQYLQLVQGLSPLRTGLWMSPAVACSIVSVLAAPVLARRIRPAYLIGAGLAISVGGLALISQAGAVGGLAAVVAGFAVISLGGGPMVTLSTDLVVGSVPPEKAGSAAAMNETSGEFGFALGIAALGSLGTAVYRGEIADAVPAGVPDQAAERAHDTLAGAVAAAEGLPGDLGAALLVSAREAFTDGMHTVAAVSSVLLAVVTVLAVALLRHVRPLGEKAPAPAGDAGHPQDSGSTRDARSRPVDADADADAHNTADAHDTADSRNTDAVDTGDAHEAGNAQDAGAGSTANTEKAGGSRDAAGAARSKADGPGVVEAAV